MLLILASSATMFDEIDQPYIQSVDELPYSLGNSNDVWQQNQNENIAGYVTILGFRNMTKRNGTYYLFGDPESLAIITMDAKGSPKNDGIIDKLDKSISLSHSRNILIASLNVVMKWHTIACDKRGCYITGRFQDRALFQDSTIIPEQIDMNYSNISIEIIKYNFTLLNKSYAEVDFNHDLYDRYTYSTPNGTLEHIYRVWRVEQTAKGIYFANETIIDIIKSKNISHARDIIDIRNETYFNANASGFYLSAKNASITHKTIEGSTIEQFNPFIIGLFLMLYACFKFIKRRL